MSTYKIDGQGKTLKEAMTNKYVIEDFQREYTWESKHIEQMLFDLDYAFHISYEEGNDVEDVKTYKPYFMGPYIISETGDKDKSLIDGQQRLTSFTLLLLYLLRNYPDLKDDLKDMICRKYFAKYSYNLQVESRRPVMDYLFSNEPIGDKKLDISCQNMLERYNDIEEMYPERLKANTKAHMFAWWLMEKVMMVEVSSTSKDDAYTIFETMNDRGKNLTSPEMLKSFLMSMIKSEDVRQKASNLWMESISKLALYGKEVDSEFFRAWFRGRFAVNLTDGTEFEAIGASLHRWFKTNYKLFRLHTDEDILQFIGDDIPFYVGVFTTIRNAEINRVPGLETILSMSPYMYATSLFYPIYLSVINRSDSVDVITQKIQVVAKAIDCFITRRLLGLQSISQSSTRYVLYGLLERLRGKDVSEISEIFSTMITEKTPEINFYQLASYYPYKFLHYLHYRMNLYLAMSENNENYVTYKESRNYQIYCLDQELTQLDKASYREDSDVRLVDLVMADMNRDGALNKSFNRLVHDEYFARGQQHLPAGVDLDAIKASSHTLMNDVIQRLWTL